MFDVIDFVQEIPLVQPGDTTDALARNRQKLADIAAYRNLVIPQVLTYVRVASWLDTQSREEMAAASDSSPAITTPAMISASLSTFPSP